MTVEIPAEFGAFVQSVIHSGICRDESEVVSEALRLFRDRQRRIEVLRDELQPSLDRLDGGEGIEVADGAIQNFMDDVIDRGRMRQESRQGRP